MTQRNWRDDNALTLGVFLNGSEIPTLTERGAPVIDDTFLILFNAWEGAVDFTLPAVSFGRRWELELSTADPEAEAGSEIVPGARGRAGRGPLARPAPPGRLVAAPRATYRLQLGPALGFREARELVPYLAELGVSHLYLSPSLQARHGSTHGYDVVDPTRVSEDLGGEDELRALSSAARDAGLGVVLDIVPNHMAATDENPFWRDPLWRAKFFDLDWRTGVHRRFFDVGELAGVRMEDPEVWEVTHQKVVELARDGVIDGVRVDHPDGLANPRRYLERLREAGIERVWVEKILEPGERLRPEWPVEGTTGYEFLNDVTALFVDPAAEEPLTRLYEELTGERRSFAEVAAEAKLEQASTTFAEEAAQLAAKLPFEARRRAARSRPSTSTAPMSSRRPGWSRTPIGRRSRRRACPPSSRGSCCSRSAGTTPSSSASSRRRRPCTRRASRTRPSTAGIASSR